MAVYYYGWSCFERSVINRNCTEWYFLRIYDTGSKINPSSFSGIIECMHHTVFGGNQMLCNVLQFYLTRASVYKNMNPRNVFLLCYHG